jgi:4-amino-4-deoxy-L-arabinose transferase-like glycosyltransferase
LLAWLVPSWIVFELVVTKLPHYVLPLYPAIAILIAGAVESKVLSQRPWLVRGAVWWFIAPILISVAVVTLAIIVARDPAFPAWPFFALAMVCGLFAWLLYQPDGAELSIVRVTIGGVLLSIGVFSITLPWLRPVFPSVTLANILHNANCANPVAASTGYEEPSLVFLAGTDTRMTDASSAADFLLQGSCRFAFIEARQERTFALRAEAIGLRYERGPNVQGYNITNGKPIDISVFQSTGSP